MRTDSFRIFPDDTVVHEDDFDNGNPDYQYYDDYEEVELPEEVIDYITDCHFPMVQESISFFRLYEDGTVRDEYGFDLKKGEYTEWTVQEALIDFIKECY